MSAATPEMHYTGSKSSILNAGPGLQVGAGPIQPRNQESRLKNLYTVVHQPGCRRAPFSRNRQDFRPGRR
eukprot:255660-Hanusia_phi.AAC.1